jgi:hypothetical protein
MFFGLLLRSIAYRLSGCISTYYHLGHIYILIPADDSSAPNINLVQEVAKLTLVRGATTHRKCNKS